MKIDGHQFDVGGGQVYDNRGKVHCPDSLDILIPKEQVLSLIDKLARLLNMSQGETILINVMGKLTYKDETINI